MQTNNQHKSSSLPQLSFYIIEKIKSLHNKNMNVTLRSNIKNKQIVNNFINNQILYQSNSKIKQQSIQKHTLQNFQKKKFIQKINYQHWSKVGQNYKRIQEIRRNQSEKHFDKQKNKIKNAQIKRKKVIQFSHESKNQSFRCVKTQNHELEQLKNSQELLKKNQQKHLQAGNRRKQYKKKQIGKLTQQIQEAQSNADLLLKSKQAKYLSKIIGKSEKLNQRLEDINQYDRNLIQEKKKIYLKNLEKVLHRKNQKQNKKQVQIEEQYCKKNQSIQFKSKQRLQRLQRLSIVLQENQKAKHKKVNHIRQQKKIEEDKKLDELYERDREHWNFLTGVKNQRDKLIANNIFDYNKIAVIR